MEKLFIYLTDNELKNYQQLCLEHEPCVLKFPKETSFRYTNYYYKLPFVGVADFEAMNRKDN